LRQINWVKRTHYVLFLRGIFDPRQTINSADG